MLGYEPPTEPVTSEPPHLRILARLGENGRVKHGVELSSGERVLPEVRYLPAGAMVNQWQVSGDVKRNGEPIGNIRARHLADGRVEMGFLSADGEVIIPDIRYLPTSLPIGVWFRSGETEVPEAG